MGANMNVILGLCAAAVLAVSWVGLVEVLTWIKVTF